jgi:hypothetical protein
VRTLVEAVALRAALAERLRQMGTVLDTSPGVDAQRRALAATLTELDALIRN